MTLKDGVKIDLLHPKLRETLETLDVLWTLAFPLDGDGLNITSGHEESVHSPNSKHYVKNCKSGFGEAFDCRVRDVNQRHAGRVGIWLEDIMRIRGIEVFVLSEAFYTPNAHLHIQL